MLENQLSNQVGIWYLLSESENYLKIMRLSDFKIISHCPLLRTVGGRGPLLYDLATLPWIKVHLCHQCMGPPFILRVYISSSPLGAWNRACCWCCCSVAKSCLALRLNGLQHSRPPCLSPSHRVCPSSCPLNQWCHLIISSFVTLFSFCLQSFPCLHAKLLQSCLPL